MGDLATPIQIQKIVRIAMEKKFADAREFAAFNAPRLFGYQRHLKDLTMEEADRLIRDAEQS